MSIRTLAGAARDVLSDLFDRRLADVRAEPERAWRRESVDRKRRYVEMHGGLLPVDAGERVIDVVLQQILDTPDFLPSAWLTLGAKAADAVAMLDTPTSRGTGFLVSPWLLLTNHHVLPDPARAAGTEAVFRFVADDENRITRSRTLRLAPERCFVTSPVDELDYTLVALAPLANGRAPGSSFGSIPMHGTIGKILSGQPVNIVQHPEGRPREIAVRNNLLIGVDDERYLTYETDSEPGSSGSPVLNDGWQLVALHSRAESRRNKHNEPVDVDGRPITERTPAARRVWVANKGIRISAIVADVAARAGDHGTDAAALITELLALGGNRRR
jgi:endonuclease G, mitochondrial